MVIKSLIMSRFVHYYELYTVCCVCLFVVGLRTATHLLLFSFYIINDSLENSLLSCQQRKQTNSHMELVSRH